MEESQENLSLIDYLLLPVQRILQLKILIEVLKFFY